MTNFKAFVSDAVIIPASLTNGPDGAARLLVRSHKRFYVTQIMSRLLWVQFNTDAKV